MRSFSIIIPARFASTRFPGKPLARIGDKTMVQRVFEIAAAVPGVDQVIVATDNDEIYEHVQSINGQAIFTHPEHASGTDRIAEAVIKARIKSDVIVNLQGDEPFIRQEQILLLVEAFDNSGCEIATLCKRITDVKVDFEDPNCVKVVRDRYGRALYFSRAGIPFAREKREQQAFKHLGIYAFGRKILGQLSLLPVSMLEKTEMLEQLRWIEYGYSIFVKETDWQSPSVDTPEDLKKAIAFLKTV